MRVGVLTGGGDCPGLNAVIRAVTKSLIHQCNAEVIGIEDGYLGLIEKRVRPLDWRSVAGIIGRGGTILGTHNISNPFAYGADRLDVSEEVIRYTKELGLDAVVTIGGDGTQSVAHRISQMGLSVVGNGVDDPDQNFFENFACKSERNYTGYCNPEIEKLFDVQSQETDLEKRKKVVWEIDSKLLEDGARPIVMWNRASICMQPYVKGYVANVNSVYNGFRFEDVWIDK